MELFKKNAQAKIKRGINKLAEIVAPTLGANGKNVILEDQLGKIQIINDGATIIDRVILENNIENVGATLAKQVAEKTNEEGGDGTTTSLVLLNAFINEISKLEGKDTRKLREELKNHISDLIKRINKAKRETKEKDIEKIAYISSLDKEMAKKIAEITKKVGKEGVIEIVESKKEGIETEIVEGLRIDRGYATQLFATDSTRKKTEMTETPVLVSRKKISVVSEIVPLMESLNARKTNKLVVFCEDMSEEVLTMLLLNKVQGQFNTLVVMTEELEDIATITGATIIDDNINKDIAIEKVGRAERITSTKYTTTILSSGNKKGIKESIKKLKKALEEEEISYEKEKIKRRIARLSGGVSIIKIGGANELETTEKKLKLEDAVNAVNSAQEDGIIEGGGVCLMRIALEIEKENSIFSKVNLSDALKLLVEVIKTPYIQILKNAGEDINNINLHKLSYNTVSKKYEDFFSTGVIDPAKVTKSAITNAFSMGMQILTAESAIINSKKKNNGN